MTNEQLTQHLLALPLAEQIVLAQILWQSIDEGPSYDDERIAVEEALRRDAELTSGAAKRQSHEDVMRAARQALASK